MDSLWWIYWQSTYYQELLDKHYEAYFYQGFHLFWCCTRIWQILDAEWRLLLILEILCFRLSKPVESSTEFMKIMLTLTILKKLLPIPFSLISELFPTYIRKIDHECRKTTSFVKVKRIVSPNTIISDLKHENLWFHCCIINRSFGFLKSSQ